MRDYPARLIEEEAASGEHARGQVRGEKGRGRQETRGEREKSAGNSERMDSARARIRLLASAHPG